MLVNRTEIAEYKEFNNYLWQMKKKLAKILNDCLYCYVTFSHFVTHNARKLYSFFRANKPFFILENF